MSLDLDASWTVWEQARDTHESKQVNSFTNMEEFWGVWKGLPQPSDLTQGSWLASLEPGGTQCVSAMSIFRTGLEPTFEDHFGHLEIDLKDDLSRMLVDELWCNTVIGLVSGFIEPADMISGVKIIDRHATSKPMTKKRTSTRIRIQLWFRGDNEQCLYELRGSFEKMLRMRPDGSENIPTWGRTKNVMHHRERATKALSHGWDDSASTSASDSAGARR